MICSEWPSLVYLSDRSQKVACDEKAGENGSLGATLRPLSAVDEPDIPAPWWRRTRYAQEVAQEDLFREEQLCQWNKLIQLSREAEGLTLPELALETRIKTCDRRP